MTEEKRYPDYDDYVAAQTAFDKLMFHFGSCFEARHAATIRAALECMANTNKPPAPTCPCWHCT